MRVVILKQWKKPKTVYKNLMKLNVAFGCNMTEEDIRKAQKVLSLPNKKENRPGLVDPLAYYLRIT